MITVHKFQLPVAGDFALALPSPAEVLHVAEQRGTPCMWVLLDDAAPRELRAFYTCGTGHDATGAGRHVGTYLGTYLLNGGAFVGHVFEAAK